MTDSNLVQMAAIEEITWGTTPGSPTTRLVRYTGESISYDITTIQSAEIISDRQVTDLVQTAARATGDLNWELSYAEHDEYRGGNLFNTWANTPFKDNAGVSDSVITDVGTTANTWVVVSGGGSFVTGHLAKSSGNTNAANNIVFRVTTSTATTVVGSGLSLVAETAPNAIARIKVVGFQGAAGDITATATGLGSTLLNFTTLGLSVGQWIKIGGTAAGDQFATAVLNDWARITVIAASALTLDNRPTGWTTDAGAAKTIKVWFGDRISNGATQRSWTIEKGFKGQVTPYYLPFTGMIPGEMKMTIRPGAIVSGSFTFMGKSAGTATTTPLTASPTASYGGDVINAVSNVGRIAEGGTTVIGPAYVLGLDINTTNNLREMPAVGYMGLVGVGKGKFEATGTLTVYFEDAVMYNKLIASTATSIACIFNKNNQAYVFSLPRVKLAGGTPSAAGQNQDVPLEMSFTALKDTVLTQKTMLIDRLEYYE